MSKETKYISVKERMQEIRFWVSRGNVILTAMRKFPPESRKAYDEELDLLEKFFNQIRLFSDPSELRIKTVENDGGYWNEVDDE